MEVEVLTAAEDFTVEEVSTEGEVFTVAVDSEAEGDSAVGARFVELAFEGEISGAAFAVMDSEVAEAGADEIGADAVGVGEEGAGTGMIGVGA